MFCDLSDPPLSSVALNAETAGFRAAELLDGLMSGRIRKPQRILVEALGVVARGSMDGVAVNDADVAAALQYIRREHGREISVQSVANEVAVSRRGLEKRFRDRADNLGGDSAGAVGPSEAIVGRDDLSDFASRGDVWIWIRRLLHPLLSNTHGRNATIVSD
jgi:AraC-like DNA-binding protein